MSWPIDDAPELGQYMVLAGTPWKVIDVDLGQQIVYVMPAAGAKSAPFAAGGGVLYPPVLAEMRTVRGSSLKCVYLDPFTTAKLV